MRLCLNMIVRNESAIIERCLRSVAPHIACYVIGDTGSTDDTVARIERVLGEQGIPGEIHHFPFENFEQARNEALERCRRSPLAFDYVLFIDADMELVETRKGWREQLTQRAYLLRQQAAEGFAYWNVRLLSRNARAFYVGVTHEHLDLDGPTARLEGAHMIDHACGSSRSEKHPRDLALLTAALEKSPNDARTTFYLAQTLRESGRHAEACALYERRIALGGWDEEVWYSRFMAARCHQALGDEARFVAGCLEAYNLRPTRAEPLHALAEHYRKTGRNEACAMLAEVGLTIAPPDDILFVDERVYRSGFRQELSISGFYARHPARRARARELCAELCVERDAPAAVRALARANWRYYAQSSEALFGGVRFEPVGLAPNPGFRASTPSLTLRDGEIWCVTRSVNYTLVDGRYHFEGEVIRTENWLSRLGDDLALQAAVPIVEGTDPTRIENAVITGLEDVRIFFDGRTTRATATVADRDASLHRRMAVFDLRDDGQVERFTLQRHEDDQHQKNWMPFVDGQGIGFVYWTDPTVVLRWDEDSRQAAPWRKQGCGWALEHQRGGSGLVPFDGGWLCVTHEVSWRGDQRTYLHRFVHFDSRFRVRAATEPFWFRHLGIEFCGGLVSGPARGLEANQLLASFSVNDGEAWLAVIDADAVRRRLHKTPRPRATPGPRRR